VRNERKARTIMDAYRTKLAMAEVGIKEPGPAPEIPEFAAAMKSFLEWSEQEYAAHPNTHKRYVTASKALLEYFRGSMLDAITAAEVEKFKLWRIRQTKKAQGKKSKRRKVSRKRLRPATVNRELAVLKHLYNHNELIVSRNPVRGVKFFDEDNQQTRVLTLEEEKLYLLAASQPLQDIARMMIETEMRPEEVYRSRREQVHLGEGYLFNPYGKTKAAKRKVPLSEAADMILRNRMQSIKGSYLFPGRVEHAPIVKVNRAHTAAVKRSGVPTFRLYDLRHTWATRMVQSGVDLVTLAAMLGHSRIEMVLRYAHPTEEHQFAAMRKRVEYLAQRK
jgi:integrase